MKNIKIYFNDSKRFIPNNFKTLVGITGLYFIFLNNIQIQYPFKKSKLIYIGMSEKITNSIGNRLQNHYDGNSNNFGIINYKKVDKLLFTFINYEMLKNIWKFRIEDLESYFILDFVKIYGVYPICNNKTGFEITKNNMEISFKIDWIYFEREVINGT